MSLLIDRQSRRSFVSLYHLSLPVEPNSWLQTRCQLYWPWFAVLLSSLTSLYNFYSSTGLSQPLYLYIFSFELLETFWFYQDQDFRLLSKSRNNRKFSPWRWTSKVLDICSYRLIQSAVIDTIVPGYNRTGQGLVTAACWLIFSMWL